MRSTSRRTILKGAGLGPAALALGAVQTKGSAEKRLVVGLIGAGGMGTGHLRLLAARKDVEVAYVCDVDARRLADGAGGRRLGVGEGPEGRVGPPPDPRRPGGGRGLDRHARPLARAGGDPRPGRRQACLCREALLPQHPRGAADGRGGGPLGQAPPGRHPEPQHGLRQGRDRAGPRRGDRRGARRQGVEQPAPRLDRQVEAHIAAARTRLRPLGRPRAAGPLPAEPAARHLAVVVRLRLRRHRQRRRPRHRRRLLGPGRFEPIPAASPAWGASRSSTTTSSSPTRSTPSSSIPTRPARAGPSSSSSSSGSGRPTCRRATRTAPRSTAPRGC